MTDKERMSAFQKGWDAAQGNGSPLNPYAYDLQPELFREFVRGYREGKTCFRSSNWVYQFPID